MAKPYTNLPNLTPQQIARFWLSVDVRQRHECWNWKRFLSPRGYGCVSFNDVSFRAHRVAYLLGKGQEPGDMLVCHTCDNRACCNPHHLFLGTALDNQRDCVQKGRIARGFRNGKTTKPEQTPRGERVYCASLTDAQVVEIRARFKAGTSTRAGLAIEYGVKRYVINCILRGKTWKHLL